MSVQFEIFAENTEYRIEWLRRNTFMIVEKLTGNAAIIPYEFTANEMRAENAKYGSDRQIATYLKIVKSMRVEFGPMYKPSNV